MTAQFDENASTDASTFIRPAPSRRSAACVEDSPYIATRPIRVGFVVGTFTFGGSETETIELVYGADPRRLTFTAIAVKLPLPLPPGEPPTDGTFPAIYTVASTSIDSRDARVRQVSSFEDAIEHVLQESDVVLTWGVPRLQEHLPEGKLPPIVVVSKDSGEWAKGFLHPNSLFTRHCVANSTMAASAFPARIRHRVKVIHDGINPSRIEPRVARDMQRRLWGFGQSDKIAGYLGRIEADKGVAKTVRGVARLGVDWKAVFIGANPNCRYVAELTALCEAYIPGRYRLLGWSHDVGSALAAFDVFCQPSDHEGFSNSLAEAWLASVPTVYTAGTGALPDLGELGIAVSPNADGNEMALALQRAYKNAELASRARAVVGSQYLIEHNIQRWTEYFESVHQARRNARVLFIASKPHEEQAYASILATCSPCLGVDLCALLVVAERNSEAESAPARMEAAFGCPLWRVSTREDVEVAIAYTRPDYIAAWAPATIAHVLPPIATVPIVDMFNPMSMCVSALPASVGAHDRT